jgi:hypothetical protein
MRRSLQQAPWSKGIAAALLAIAVVAPARGDNRRPPLGEWFPHLSKGVWVKVEGQLTAGPVLRAHEIKVLRGDLDEVEVTGTVAALDAAGKRFTMGSGLQVVTNHRTEVQGAHGRHVAFAELRQGDRVEAEGQIQRDGTLLADEIEIKRLDTKPEKHSDEDEITGRIESVDASVHRLVVLGVSVLCDENTKNKTPVPE